MTPVTPRARHGLAALLAAAVAVEQCWAWAGVPTKNKHNLRWQPPVESRRSVALVDVARHLDRAFLDARASAGHHLELEAYFAAIFAALPKNKHGLLSHQAFGYAIKRYFLQGFGMHIRGIGGDLDEELQGWKGEPDIRQVMVPATMEALLERTEAGRGMSLRDLAAMTSALEHLIAEDSFRMLRFSYAVNNLSMAEGISMDEFVEVAISMHVFMRDGIDGRSGDEMDAEMHMSRKKQRRNAPAIKSGVFYMSDAAMNWAYANSHRVNPFRDRTWSFDALSQIFRDGLRGRGKDQNFDCLAIKDYMVALDPMGSGRVPLSIFYDQPDKHVFDFSEPLDYLAAIGALDMSNPSQPGVVIPNYVLGAANCYRSAALYSYCCISECDTLMADLELGAKGPYASPEFLLERVSKFSTSTVEPREVPIELVQKLERVAERHGGLVPVHGRLFAQWLHFAFPSECPYPQVALAAAPDHDFQVEFAESFSSPIEPSLAAWTDEESLPLLGVPVGKERGPWRSAANVVFSCLAVFSMLSALCGNFQGLLGHFRLVRRQKSKTPTFCD